jgi:uncharacterized double-CXXCG motif protein
MQFGPLRGTAQGTFGPVTAKDDWEVLVREDALEQLQAAGIRGLIPVRAELEGLANTRLFELELPVRGLLHRNSLLEGPRCRTCGCQEVSISPECWLDGDSLPHDVDLFRPANAVTVTVVSERFVESVQALGPSDIVFNEIAVVPEPRSNLIH